MTYQCRRDDTECSGDTWFEGYHLQETKAEEHLRASVRESDISLLERSLLRLDVSLVVVLLLELLERI